MKNPTIELRTLTQDDIATIMSWPAYPPGFADLDYALRSDGWLAEFRNKPDTWCFAVELGGELLAFSILSKTAEAEGEFRIALRADKIGQGLGSSISRMIIAQAWGEIGLSKIHLIVRKNNPRAIRLYQSLGFVGQGECCLSINGKQVHFLTMEMHLQKHLE